MAMAGGGFGTSRGHSQPVCLGAFRVRKGLCTELVCGVLGSPQALKFEKQSMLSCSGQGPEKGDGSPSALESVIMVRFVVCVLGHTRGKLMFLM